jgi:regulator of protease activity HflC (stomatin/prohibitin superfamily)
LFKGVQDSYFAFAEVTMLDTVLILAIVAAVLGVTVVRTAVIIVRQGYEYTLERFGKYQTTLRPGFHFIIPFVHRVGHRVNMMERVLDVPSQEVISKDNAVLTVDGVVFFQALDAAKAAYEVFRLEHAILNLTVTNIRTVLGSMDLDESLSKRDDINARLLIVVDEATTPWGIKVTRIEIKDISPPKDLVDSMARQMKAEREKRATILEAEGTRQAEILEAEGLKQAAILQAEGRKEAAFRDAEARERSAEAEARATTMVSDAIGSGNMQAINYFVAQKYVEALSDFAKGPNTKTLLLPMEATGILSSLAGIAEVARETFKKDDRG